MTTQSKMKIPRKIYSYSNQEFSHIGDFTVEADEYRKDQAWPDTLKVDGYRGAEVGAGVEVSTVGGLPARVYRRAASGQAKRKESLFSPYDFVVDVDVTYMVVIGDFLEFLRFSREYLAPAEPVGVDTWDIDRLRDALGEIRDAIYGIMGSVEGVGKKVGPTKTQR